MARKVRDRELGDRASRAKLKPRGKPYWRTLDQGVHIGYRKNPKAGGKWVGRVYRKRGGGGVYHAHVARWGGRQGGRPQRGGRQVFLWARRGPPQGRR